MVAPSRARRTLLDDSSKQAMNLFVQYLMFLNFGFDNNNVSYNTKPTTSRVDYVSLRLL